MNFDTGDKVYVKSLQKEARVLHYLGQDNYEVRLENDEVVRVEVSDLDYPYLYMFLKEKEKKQKKTIKKYAIPKREEDRAPRRDKGLYLAYWPEYFSDDFDDLVEEVKLYFYNETSEEMEFFYSFSTKQEQGFEIKKTVKAFEEFYLHSFSMEALSDRPTFTLQLAPKGEVLDNVNLKIKPKELFRKINSLAQENTPAYYHKLADSVYDIYVNPLKAQIDNLVIGSQADKKQGSYQPIEMDEHSLDLHTEALFPEGTGNMTSRQILDEQIGAMQAFLAQAIKEKTKKITIVHGIGQGILKDQIHAILKQHSFVKKYQNELHPKYGYGATEIWLK